MTSKTSWILSMGIGVSASSLRRGIKASTSACVKVNASIIAGSPAGAAAINRVNKPTITMELPLVLDYQFLINNIVVNMVVVALVILKILIAPLKKLY